MALAFSFEEKKERIRQAMEIYNTTGSWSKADNIVRRQSVEKWVRNPELLAYAQSLGYQQMCTDEVASFAPTTAHYTARIAFSGALVHMRDGKVVCRDGARIHYAISTGRWSCSNLTVQATGIMPGLLTSVVLMSWLTPG